MSSTGTSQSGFAHDEQAFRAKIPYSLVPTNLQGAYASPAASVDFDPNKASAAELIKSGLLWRRPAATDDPALLKAWQQVFARKWLAKDRIIPELHPQLRRTHALKKPLTKVADSSYLGNAWAGAGTVGGAWTGIIGFWNIPFVSMPTEPQGLDGGWTSSSWIGIDGFFLSNDVLQAGIEQHVSPFGIPTYVAWFEWFAPADPWSPPYIYQVNITNFPVSQGQQVYCSVQYVNNKTAGYIYFANEATGQHFSITLVPPPGATFTGNSIEWIMEAPNGGEPKTALPRFTPVTFTSAIGCGPARYGNPQNGDTTNIQDASGKILTAVKVGNYTATIDFIG
jgi:hypothetical protein